MNLFTVVIFCAVFVHAYGDDAADEAVSKNATPQFKHVPTVNVAVAKGFQRA
jgi:hypothetical protein